MSFKKYTEGRVNCILDYYECSCHSSEHSFTFRLDLDDGEMYLSPHLSDYKNFFQRLWHGIKYIFGHTSKYGDFDEVIIKKEDVKNLRKLLDEYDNLQEKLVIKEKESNNGSNSRDN